MTPINRGSELSVSTPNFGPMPSIEEQYLRAGFSIPQLLEVLKAYWRLSCSIVAAILVMTIVVIAVIPRSYTARATLIFDYENHDPLAGEQFPLAMMQSYVATQTELITSPVVLGTVLDRLGLLSDPEFSGGFHGEAAAQRDFAMKHLSTLLQVDEGRGGQILYVTATAHTAAKAAALSNAVADVYLELYKKRVSGPATERAERYSAQLGELREKVAAAQANVTEFRRRNGLTDVSTAGSASDTQAITELQLKLLEAENSRRVAESKSTGDHTVSDEALASHTVEALKQSLTSKEAELAQLRSTLGAQHPKILELQSQINALRTSLDSEVKTLSANNQQRVQSTRDLEGKYHAALSSQREKLLAIRQLQDEGAKLLVELESAQTVYKRALDGYDQIMFASTQKTTNVTLIDRATPPAKPSKPSRVKLLLIGLLAGLGAGILVPLAYELFINRRVRHRLDMERDFGLPVLAELSANLRGAL